VRRRAEQGTQRTLSSRDHPRWLAERIISWRRLPDPNNMNGEGLSVRGSASGPDIKAWVLLRAETVGGGISACYGTAHRAHFDPFLELQRGFELGAATALVWP
jgi:hypothetical protein